MMKNKPSTTLDWPSKGKSTPSRDDIRITIQECYKGGIIQKCPQEYFNPNEGNHLVQGDNLCVLQALLDHGMGETVNVIYIDPPFWTGTDYYDNATGAVAYTDRWGADLDTYLSMICPRINLMRDLLSNTGSIFVHVDWHAGHYIKVLLDEIFGRDNLVNEIVWHYGGPSPVKTSFPRKHDIIFFYSKTREYKFKPQYNPLKPYLLKRSRKDPDGRLWVDQNVGRITERKFQELMAEGRVFKTKTGRYRRKQFLDEMEGDMIDDVWTIPIINSQAKERLGYPTQKPEALLTRIIECASNPGDLVMDFFCGSGTTLVAASKVKRRWFGVDNSPVSIAMTIDRLKHLGDELKYTFSSCSSPA